MAVYRCFLLFVTACVYMVQKPIEVRIDVFSLSARRILGYVVSIAFLCLLVEYALLIIGRRIIPRIERLVPDRSLEGLLALTATFFLVLTLGSEWVYGYLLTYYHPVPRMVAAFVLIGWLVWVGWLLVEKRLTIHWFLALSTMVVVTRVIGCLILEHATGDMLQTVDRALGTLLAGHQPYRVYPPAMPYFPLSFLSYLPPKLLNLDLRWSNVFVEIASIAVMMLPRRNEPLSLSAAALPVLMLMPSWTVYGMDSTFSTTVLAVVLLGQSLVGWGKSMTCYSSTTCHTARSTPRSQALFLGVAVATNQTLSVLAPFVGIHWLYRRGLRSTLWLVAYSLLLFLVILLPFAFWDFPNFFVATFGLRPFGPETFAGRFTLRPLAEGFFMGSATALMIVSYLMTLACVARRRTAESVLVGAGLAYCVFLLLLHRTFSHYFLPVMALVFSFGAELFPLGRQQTSRE